MTANQSPRLDSYDSSYHEQSTRCQDKQIDTIHPLNTSDNDTSYLSDTLNDRDTDILSDSANDVSCGYKKATNKYLRNDYSSSSYSNNSYSTASALSIDLCSDGDLLTGDKAYSQQPVSSKIQDNNKQIAHSSHTHNNSATRNNANKNMTTIYNDIPERIFMTSLIKHTGIALAIIIPLAAFSAYAATPAQTVNTTAPAKAQTAPIDIAPEAIIYHSASKPTAVDKVDLIKYSGDWYEIGRLPLYFQRNCAGNVMANYTGQANDSGIVVTNSCTKQDGSQMVAKGLAKPTDSSGSQLKVTFLPSWIRWLPVGRADYWVLARDAEYQTALVGTPSTDNLWLLARSPNVSQQTYTKYRQIAEEQGYDLKEFTLTPHSNQTVSLAP